VMAKKTAHQSPRHQAAGLPRPPVRRLVRLSASVPQVSVVKSLSAIPHSAFVAPTCLVDVRPGRKRSAGGHPAASHPRSIFHPWFSSAMARHSAFRTTHNLLITKPHPAQSCLVKPTEKMTQRINLVVRCLSTEVFRL
jgi:hypothetical protein